MKKDNFMCDSNGEALYTIADDEEGTQLPIYEDTELFCLGCYSTFPARDLKEGSYWEGGHPELTRQIHDACGTGGLNFRIFRANDQFSTDLINEVQL